MTTTTANVLERCDIRECDYSRFTDNDKALLDLLIFASECNHVRADVFVTVAKRLGFKTRQIRATLRKLDRFDVIHTSIDRRTKAHWIELMNVDGTATHCDISDIV